MKTKHKYSNKALFISGILCAMPIFILGMIGLMGVNIHENYMRFTMLLSLIGAIFFLFVIIRMVVKYAISSKLKNLPEEKKKKAIFLIVITASVIAMSNIWPNYDLIFSSIRDFVRIVAAPLIVVSTIILAARSGLKSGLDEQ